MKRRLPKTIKILFSDMRQAIIGIILSALILSVGGIYLFANNVWFWLLSTMQLPVPLWATIALVLLCCGYTYLQFEKSHSLLHSRKSNNTPSRVIDIDEGELNVLTYLAVQESDETSPDNISDTLGINLQVAAFHLDNLKKKCMVDSRKIAPFDHSPKRFWSLSPDGRRYLIENKHIS